MASTSLVLNSLEAYHKWNLRSDQLPPVGSLQGSLVRYFCGEVVTASLGPIGVIYNLGKAIGYFGASFAVPAYDQERYESMAAEHIDGAATDVLATALAVPTYFRCVGTSSLELLLSPNLIALGFALSPNPLGLGLRGRLEV